MFIFVILAYVVIAAMASCGVINAYGVIANSEQDMGLYVFFGQMGNALLPLLGATLLFGLLQVAQLLESIYFHLENDEDEPITPVRKKKVQEDDAPFFGLAVVEDKADKPGHSPFPPVPAVLPKEEPEASSVAQPVNASQSKEQEDDMSFFRMN